MRAALLLLALALAGCGDDTTTVPRPDLSVGCMGSPSNAAHDCCLRGVARSQPCATVGDYCSGFEIACTCGADLVWSCRNPATTDLATPIFD